MIYLFSGDIELKNLVIKPAALEELDLPVQCVYGKIGGWKSNVYEYLLVLLVIKVINYRRYVIW